MNDQATGQNPPARHQAALHPAAYPVILRPTDAASASRAPYTAEVPDLPGCGATGSTAVEAMTNAEQAITDWIADARRHGHPVPPPSSRFREVTQ